MIPTHIIIHHSLTKDGQVVDWNAIRKYHIGLGWKNIGYHFGIELMKDQFELIGGRLPSDPGAHCKQEGMNNQSIGICLVGNFDLDPPPDPQIDLLVSWIHYFRAIYNIPIKNIEPHRKYAPYKSCPGLKFPWQAFINRL